ncbi:MAG: T9SS C-terminal target domain-containing protein [Bacteroidetes bacterium]|nr:T9SS C-terminal target domain-containing protein [Bacteroidota bacterium]
MDTKYMKGFSFATLIIFKIGMCYAQPFFNFNIDSSVYNELNHPYSILPDQYWTPATSSSSNIIMPFNFNFYGIDYNSIWISKNGAVTFFHPQTFFANRIYILNARYREKNKNAPYVSSINVQTDTVNNNRVFKVEYNNVGLYESSDTSDYANFQLWLFEGSNIFEIHIGKIKADTSAWLQSIGPYVGIGKDEDKIQVLLGGLPQNPKFLTKKDTFLLSYPAQNTVYRFSPLKSSLNEIEKYNRFNVYPNPTNDKLTINCNVQIRVKIRVLDVSTLQEVKLFENIQMKSSISLSELKAGMYILQLITENELKNIRVIKL